MNRTLLVWHTHRQASGNLIYARLTFNAYNGLSSNHYLNNLGGWSKKHPPLRVSIGGSSSHEINTLNQVTKYSKQLQKFEKISSLSLEQIKEILEILDVDEFIYKSLSNEILNDLCLNFLKTFEDKCTKVIEKETGQKRLKIGTKVRVKYDLNGPKSLLVGDIATITNVVRFEEDTFGQGWYIFELDDYYRVYLNEIEEI